MTRSPRSTVTISGLERTIVAAVQQTSADCRGFLAVYIEHCLEDEVGANWRIKGIKYGRALREPCDAALDEIVRNLKERYVVELSRSAAHAPVAAEPQVPVASVSLLSAARRRLSQNS